MLMLISLLTTQHIVRLGRNDKKERLYKEDPLGWGLLFHPSNFPTSGPRQMSTAIATYQVAKFQTVYPSVHPPLYLHCIVYIN